GRATTCQTIHTEPSGPRFLRLSPDGRLVAYFTTHGSGGRLRILDAHTRLVTDLGISRSICPPIWSSASALWIYEKGASGWKEIEASSGRPTGQMSLSRGHDTDWVCNRGPTTDGRSDDGLRVRRNEIG